MFALCYKLDNKAFVLLSHERVLRIDGHCAVWGIVAHKGVYETAARMNKCYRLNRTVVP